MQIKCRSCANIVPAEGLNLDHMIAKCAHCHAVFRFEIEGQAPAGPPERERANVAQPDGFTVEDHGRVLIISRRWRSGCAIAFFSVFALVWNGFVWSIYWLPGAPVGIFNLFLVPFQLVGLGLAYLVAALFVNSTTITVDNRNVRVKHHPLPFPGSVELGVTDIEQLFVRNRLSTSSSKSGSRSIRVHYSVEAVLRDGKRKPLLRQVSDADTALWLEQVLEERLGIADRPVRGEM